MWPLQDTPPWERRACTHVKQHITPYTLNERKKNVQARYGNVAHAEADVHNEQKSPPRKSRNYQVFNNSIRRTSIDWSRIRSRPPYLDRENFPNSTRPTILGFSVAGIRANCARKSSHNCWKLPENRFAGILFSAISEYRESSVLRAVHKPTP